jgi:ribosomal protein L4
LPDPGATKKWTEKFPKPERRFAHQLAPAQTIFLEKLFRPGKNSFKRFSKLFLKTFPDSRPQSQNVFKTIRCKNFRQNFLKISKKIFPGARNI